MKRALWMFVALVLVFTAARADVIGIGWTCSTSSSCNTHFACSTPNGPRHPRTVTETCCPPPCTFPCEMQECIIQVVGVFCDC